MQEKDVADNLQSLCVESSLCGSESDYVPSGGDPSTVQGRTFISENDELCKFKKPKFTQDQECEEDPTNCDIGLVCVSDAQEKAEEANKHTLCLPESLCGTESAYSVASETSPAYN